MKSDLLPALRKELEINFGRKILSSRDCLQMVDDIYQKTGYTINANTLRRFFGLVKTAYTASPSTLMILTKYCGFNSIDEVKNISAGVNTDTSINKEEILHYLVSSFKNFPVRDNYNPVMEVLIQQTVIFLERNPSLIDRFQREIAGTPAGQYYYFERSVNMDRLNTYYGDGLRYYLRSKNSAEAIIFAHSLLVFRYWLTGNSELVEKNMAILSSVPVSINFPSHILARYIAARLFYTHSKGDIPDKILTEASKYYSVISSRTDQFDPDFDLIIGEALILTNHYGEGAEYIRRGKSKLPGSKNNFGNENPFTIWEKLISNRRTTALKAINTALKPGKNILLFTSPLTKKYFTLLSLSADSKTRKNNIEELLLETGFNRLF
jgi:hypothetical protein